MHACAASANAIRRIKGGAFHHTISVEHVDYTAEKAARKAREQKEQQEREKIRHWASSWRACWTRTSHTIYAICTTGLPRVPLRKNGDEDRSAGGPHPLPPYMQFNYQPWRRTERKPQRLEARPLHEGDVRPSQGSANESAENQSHTGAAGRPRGGAAAGHGPRDASRRGFGAG